MDEVVHFLLQSPPLQIYIRDFDMPGGFLWTMSPELDTIHDRFSTKFGAVALAVYLRQAQRHLKSLDG